MDVIYKYLVHWLYEFDFNEKPELWDQEAIIIPSGFDTPALANQMAAENQEPFENKFQAR